jgi:hypothetical protein
MKIHITPLLVWSKKREMLALQVINLKVSAYIFTFQRQFGHIYPTNMFTFFIHW